MNFQLKSTFKNNIYHNFKKKLVYKEEAALKAKTMDKL